METDGDGYMVRRRMDMVRDTCLGSCDYFVRSPSSNCATPLKESYVWTTLATQKKICQLVTFGSVGSRGFIHNAKVSVLVLSTRLPLMNSL